MWDKRYDRPDYVYGIEPNDFLKENIHYFKEDEVLSLGEGEGRNGVFLAETGRNVVAVDSSRIGLKKAQELAARKGVVITTKIADLSEFDPGENLYSGIISIFCHLSSRVRIDLHKRCASALKPGGVFLLEGFTPDQIGMGTGGPYDPDMMHSLKELLDTFSEFEVIYGKELIRFLKEGLFHEGNAAVVQFIARKM